MSIIHYLNSKDAKPSKYVTFGFSDSVDNVFDMYIQGYTDAAEQLFQRFESSDDNDIDVHDTVVYPLFFIYRHIVELHIKKIYIKYVARSEAESQAMLNKVSHHLCSAWRRTQDTVQSLIDRFPSSGFTTVSFSEAIKEIDTFDSNSMKMRYPITKGEKNKCISLMNTKPQLIDLTLTHQGMIHLFGLFEEFDCYFDNVFVYNDAPTNFVEVLNGEYNRLAPILAEIMHCLDAATKGNTVPRDDAKLVELSSIRPKNNVVRTQLEEIIDRIDVNQAKTLMLLAYAGRDLFGGRIKLSETLDDRRKDILCLLFSAQDEHPVLSYDNQAENKWAITEKLRIAPSALALRWLSQIQEEFKNAEIFDAETTVE